ncbi:MAG: helicase-related protein [Candidatus Thalassarchaeaceae archaeon]
MLSVKALAEGVDVPSADVGIIRVSTGSVRQRIQTIGRMLRKSGAEKATVYIFHVTQIKWRSNCRLQYSENR